MPRSIAPEAMFLLHFIVRSANLFVGPLVLVASLCDVLGVAVADYSRLPVG